jgi:hypothetical protein
MMTSNGTSNNNFYQTSYGGGGSFGKSTNSISSMGGLINSLGTTGPNNPLGNLNGNYASVGSSNHNLGIDDILKITGHQYAEIN